jgi:CBS domain-containing protein
MNAREVMTADVISVRPDTPLREVAKLLAASGISAVPVVDAAGAPIGMISEGDLIGRDEAARRARQDWWLTLLAEGEALNPEFLATVHKPDSVARNVMSAPVITVPEDTPIGEIAKLLHSYRIKRVPVLHDGRVVGIVSRADLVRALAEQEEAKPQSHHTGGLFAGALAGIDQHFRGRHAEGPSQTLATAPQSAEPDETTLTVADFRALVADHDHKHLEEEQQHRNALTAQRRQLVADLVDKHISDSKWRALVHQARQAAERGATEFTLLQFPSGLCNDGARAINSGRAEWPATLRGEAAELYVRWERDLKPHGFHLGARILDFPGGMPGDVGLFLSWGG